MARLILAVASVFGMAALSLGDEPTKLSDEEITKLMVGKWENADKFGNITIRTVENFKKDGTLEREDTINGSQKVNVKATWEVKDGVLTTVVLEGGPGKGTTVRGKVVSIDYKSQLVQMEAGAEVTKTRVKE
jgi:hypothetical protein